MKTYSLIISSLLLISTLVFAGSNGNDKVNNIASGALISASASSFAMPMTAADVPNGTAILDNVTFGILLGTFTYPLSIESEYCKKVRDALIVTQTNVGYVYSVGAFSNYAQAEAYRQQLVQEGYQNANVISFYKDIPLLSVEK
jgi:hypothetical protein